MRELRQFVEHAEQIGADPEVDAREWDDNGDLIGLEAVGGLDAEPLAE